MITFSNLPKINDFDNEFLESRARERLIGNWNLEVLVDELKEIMQYMIDKYVGECD